MRPGVELEDGKQTRVEYGWNRAGVEKNGGSRLTFALKKCEQGADQASDAVSAIANWFQFSISISIINLFFKYLFSSGAFVFLSVFQVPVFLQSRIAAAAARLKIAMFQAKAS